ncbi:MAG: DUF1801 domain-containing protein [Bacteroidetes bacterium]|nr:DUF1801 domain-containing protein [Bacteroidota bacterium]
MTAKAGRSVEVDAYIASHPSRVQAILKRVRTAVHRGAPDAVEVISYRMPALKQHGIVIYFAAFKHHVGLYPPIKGDRDIERRSQPYANEKGNLRFPFDKPIPYDLIEDLARLSARQDAEKASAKAAARNKSARKR